MRRSMCRIRIIRLGVAAVRRGGGRARGIALLWDGGAANAGPLYFMP